MTLIPKPANALATTLLCLITAAAAQSPFRSIDGSGNNPIDPSMGAANKPLVRLMSIGYVDGWSVPRSAGLPSARDVSNMVCAQMASIPNTIEASDMVWQWGQFVDHDIDLTTSASPAEPFDIPVPISDPFFDPFSTGTQTIGLTRSEYVIDAAGVRQQMNGISAWIDGSNVYGSDQARANELRTLDGTGRLKTSAGDLLPFNVNGLPNAGGPGSTLFLAGDIRANEQSGLTAMHTLFVREHNYWADRFGMLPIPGNLVYELARSIVSAELQAITYNEFLPALLGPDALEPYAGYDPTVNAEIANVFSTAAYRFGHSMLSATLLRLDSNLNEIPAGHLPLQNAFFNPQMITNHGIAPYLLGLANQQSQAVDTRLVDDVRNFLFGPPGAGGLDLAALNIQRGREHGLPCYNQLRIDCGLAPRSTFMQINPDPSVHGALASVYASIDDIDPWVGILAEPTLPEALVGETAFTVLKGQFERLRDGDRFFYKNSLPRGWRRFIERQTLSRIIRRNTSIDDELEDDVFHVDN